MSSTDKHPRFIRHSFKVSTELLSYSVFELVEVLGNEVLLTEKLRIEKFRGKSNASKISEYLRLRNCSNWSKCEQVTGLRPTIKDGLFYGDWLKPNETNAPKKTLLIFVFSKDRKRLIIDVYRDFYPNHNGILQNIVNAY